MTNQLSLVFLLAALVLFAPGCSSPLGDKQGLAESARRGDLIVAAIEKYHADNGQYPKALADLVPKYIQDIPLPTWGVKSWTYELTEEYFDLRVDKSPETGDGYHHFLWYCGPDHGWQIGD